jgi:putative tricarboxylic transport membrane protein
MAVIFGALLIQGVTPGPQLVTEHPELFWGVVNSMYIGNVLLLIMSIPLLGVFVRILRVRATVLAPITVLITLVGAYTVNNSVFDIGLVIGFGVLGYLMKKAGFDPGPMVLAFVLGSLLETSLRRSLLLFDGDPTGFVTRPISGTLFALFLAVVLMPLAGSLLRRRRAALTPPGEPIAAQSVSDRATPAEPAAAQSVSDRATPGEPTAAHSVSDRSTSGQPVTGKHVTESQGGESVRNRPVDSVAERPADAEVGSAAGPSGESVRRDPNPEIKEPE